MYTSEYDTFYYGKNENFFNYLKKNLIGKGFKDVYNISFDKYRKYICGYSNGDVKYIDTANYSKSKCDFSIINKYKNKEYKPQHYHGLYFLTDKVGTTRMSEYFQSSDLLYMYCVDNIDSLETLPLFSNYDKQILKDIKGDENLVKENEILRHQNEQLKKQLEDIKKALS